MKFFLALSLMPLLFLGQTVFAEGVPWKSGEKLSYEISWGWVLAAEGTFTATEKPDQWDFHLYLKSRGVIDTFYPLEDWFWSEVQKEPWRSLEFGEFRNEPEKYIRERTQINYDTGEGVRERWERAKTDRFAVKVPALDDLGSMLYRLRCGDWPLNQPRELAVYENGAVKGGEARCVAVEEEAIGSWPRQKVLKIEAEPTGDEKKKGSLIIWITDDERRLPLRAHLVFKYGTFTIDLVKVE